MGHMLALNMERTVFASRVMILILGKVRPLGGNTAQKEHRRLRDARGVPFHSGTASPDSLMMVPAGKP